MSKRRKRISLAVWLALILLTLAGVFLTDSAGQSESIQELMPCMADVLDVRFIEHGDVMDIDSDIMDMLAEHGWIELKTETITD